MSTSANGITELGVIFGGYADSNGVGRGFIDNAGTFSDVMVPGSSSTEVTGVNASGEVVGIYSNSGSQQSHGFVETDGTFTTIDYPGAQSTFPGGVNDAGQISGSAVMSSSTSFQEEGFVADPVCFVSGTQIRTTCGSVAVELLVAGDLAVTASSEARPIRWLGHRAIDCRRHPRPAEVMPIRIEANAFGANCPARDLYVSPGHAICVDVAGEVLIPASALVNGTTVTQVDVERVIYWHVELDSHDILLAENLPAESYLEMGNRAFFAEAEAVTLHARPDAPVATHADFCRPYVDSGPQLEAVRAMLRERQADSGTPRKVIAAA